MDRSGNNLNKVMHRTVQFNDGGARDKKGSAGGRISRYIAPDKREDCGQIPEGMDNGRARW